MFFAGAAVMLMLGVIIVQIPAVQSRLDWRVFRVSAYVNGILHPIGPIPTAIPNRTGFASQIVPTTASTQIPTATASPTQSPTAVPPLPSQVSLPAPAFEDETKFPNNCGPATLTMALRMYGWTGDQFSISNVIKPVRGDRNVNPDELRWWVLNNPGGLGLKAEYRVNGNITLLKGLLAAGFPVIIEETFTYDTPYWPNDDLWAAHYVLLTGYDDSKAEFTIQDAFHGPNLTVSYTKLEKDWEPFNHMYFLVYTSDEEAKLSSLLGSDWDADTNRQNALIATQAATISNPKDAFAWFDYGSNLVYFERYAEAKPAYDTARSVGLPQRMFRYQFGPFISDFFTNHTDDLLTITQDTLNMAYSQENVFTKGQYYSEEAWLWRGYALQRTGDLKGANEAWKNAIAIHPNYCDAEYAINNYIQATYQLGACVP
jgi:tetratricopeptide (TPR) repeat protein